MLGGDHSVALGTLGGLARARGVGGVLWLDAHGDLNTPETSPTGNVHGMPLAAALGLTDGRFASEMWTLPAVEPGRVALVGLRSLDTRERERIRELGIRAYTMSDIDRIGIEREPSLPFHSPCMASPSIDDDGLALYSSRTKGLRKAARGMPKPERDRGVWGSGPIHAQGLASRVALASSSKSSKNMPCRVREVQARHSNPRLAAQCRGEHGEGLSHPACRTRR